ncbi:MAG: tyrosine-type recombinase/integrase [Bryobacteraceae bacterium]
MPRTRSQHPRVKRRGHRGYEYWAAEYHAYTLVDGKERRSHKVQEFGLCNATTRAEAQAKCDRFIEGVNGHAAHSGSMTVAEFWREIYLPARTARWAYNTARTIESSWRVRLEPELGKMRLDAVLKHNIEAALAKAARNGAGQVLLDRLQFIARDVFEEAMDNEFIERNPARKVRAPKGKPRTQPRSLTEAEVTRLLSAADGEERMMWSVMLLCGTRPSEMLALTRADVVPAGLRIERQAVRGQNAPTKNRKKRTAPLAAQLRADLVAHIEAMPQSQVLLFPNNDGTMRWLNQERTRNLLISARKAAGVPDLTWRMCRTTFASLFDGDVSDAQSILGHARPEFTATVYRRAQQERAQKSVDKLAARVVPIRKPA